MSKQNQAMQSATATKSQQKPAPTPMQDLVTAPEMIDVLDFTATTSFANNTQRLGNPNLPRIQRQMMAGRIGQMQGNGHLGNVISSLQPNARSKDSVSVAPSITSRLTPANLVVNRKKSTQSLYSEKTKISEQRAYDSEEELLEKSEIGPENDRNFSQPNDSQPPEDLDRHPLIQAKLVINNPNDKYEREADQIADKVTSLPSNEQTLSKAQHENSRISSSRLTVIRKNLSEEEHQQEASPSLPEGVEDRIQSLQGRGEPLPDETREFFEQRMNADFSNVRIHTASNAVQTSRDIGARAFTVGSDIAFNSNEYDTQTDRGQHLLAHELTHVIQQGAAGEIKRKPEQTVDKVATLDESICPSCGKESNGPCADCNPDVVQQSDNEVIQTDLNISHNARLGTIVQRRSLSSLDGIAASQLGPAVDSIQQATPQTQEQEQAKLKESLPEIQQPTGMPATSQARQAAATELQTGAQTEAQAPQANSPKVLDDRQKDPDTPVPGSNLSTQVVEPASSESGDDQAWFSAVRNQARQFARQVPTRDAGLSTSAGNRPRVDLTGDANPDQLGYQQQTADTDVNQKLAEGNQKTEENFGENDIAPLIEPELMRPDVELSPPPGLEAAELRAVALPDDAKAEFDQNAAPYLQDQLAPKLAQHEQERTTYLEQSKQTRTDGLQQIDTKTAEVRAEQEALKEQARGDVAAEKGRWQAENQRIKNEYSTKSSAKRQEIDQQVQQKVQTTEQEADQKLTEAENEAEAQRAKAESEAAKKKQEVQERPKNAWERFKGAVSSAFDEIKGAVNAIFGTLRSLVKGIIEAAKSAVNKLIDMARSAIMSLLQGFAEFVKGLVSLALAAFPEVAAKARAWIDRRVEEATAAINRAAERLKEATSAILDAIGAGLDAVLAAYQKIYNLLLDGIKFLTVGLLEIMEKLGNLVEAAKQMPDQFMGQLQEEVLGMNLSEPLPFERLPEECAGGEGAAGATQEDPETASLLAKDEFSEEDIGVEEVAPLELDPELLASLPLQGDGEFEFGESNDPEHSMEAVLADVSGGGETKGTSEQATEQQGENATVCDDEATAQQKLDEMMNQPVEGAAGTQKQGEPAQAGEVPAQMRTIGPLTAGQRGQYMLHQMIKGVTEWFEANWPYLLAGAVAAIAAFIGLNILTGGAIMAAMPPLMQVISVVMGGVALANVMSHIGDYLSRGWGGNIASAAQSLARGLAAGAVELVFALLFNAGAIIKATRSGLRGAIRVGAQAAKGTVRATIASTKQLGRIAARGAKATVRNGKIMFQSLRQGFARGAKSLDDLAGRLSKRLRFRKFKLVRSGRRIQLWGLINPWVRLANGDLREVSQGDIIGQNHKLGDEVKLLTGESGRLVGTGRFNPSRKWQRELGEDLFNRRGLTPREELKGGISRFSNVEGGTKIAGGKDLIDMPLEDIAKLVGETGDDAVKANRILKLVKTGPEKLKKLKTSQQRGKH